MAEETSDNDSRLGGGPDRRKDIRAHFAVLEVRGKYKRDSFFGYAKNLSRSGMYLSTPNPRGPGDVVSISFRMPFENVLVNCACQVVWKKTKTDEHGGPGMGIRFLDLEGAIGEKIKEWSASIEFTGEFAGP